MEQPDAGNKSDPTATSNATTGNGSTRELGWVKRVLSVKLENAGAHYTDITPLGKGSFGEVHTAKDGLLGREVAIKSLKKKFREDEDVVDRFLKEARGTAQLEHPNIMPVHEMGVLDELGVYFTMKKIQGENLKEILDRLEANTSFYIHKYPLNTLLEIFLSVCNGVAFAHSKGVIHRDLKPANIMIGEFGEVLILDWGLVKQLGESGAAAGNVQLRMDELNDGSHTLDGAISGTPNFMSPEQADGNISEIDFQSDVYSLGAILYNMLTYKAPFEKMQLRKLLECVKEGNFLPPRKRRPDLKIPRELNAICMTAMARFQVNRYRSVEDLADDIRNYIGHRDVSIYKAPRHVRFWKACRRNPVKASVIAAVATAFCLAYGAQSAMMYGNYRSDVEDGEVHLALGSGIAEEAFQLFDELKAESARQELREETEVERRLQNELRKKLGEIHNQFNIATSNFESVPPPLRNKKRVREGLYQILRQRLELALYRGDTELAKEWLGDLDKRLEAWGKMPADDVREFLYRVRRQVEGVGSLEVTASENVEQVLIFSLKNVEGRLVPDQDTAIAKKAPPFTVQVVPEGSYLAMVTLSGGQGMKPFPIHIGHGEKKVVHAWFPSKFYKGMAFVPGGEFVFGGEESRFYRKQSVALEPFFIKETEVTFGEYLEFWKSLSDPALKQAYRSRVQVVENAREFHDVWDGAGNLLWPDLFKLEHPVVGIPREAAEAYCAWLGEKTGAAIKLPTVQQWEKAARGVDGRTYVWGNKLDNRYTLTKNNDAAKGKYPIFAPPKSFVLTDKSVYNVFDLAGNVREMTASKLPNSESFYQLKGGSASIPENFLPCSYSSDTAAVPSDVGFRYIMEVAKEQ
ncbi:bifunctional serine/threonine-protein kinase/formylglycine-generating enzyme family protein [Pontiella sp.]|uniref:bifunctional serine/threonine-protein kinase/formylglycine-generating enzyme family protein n=1 Tax=Pontiella sp. TaxID=2837462 RepID=UPI003566D886